MISFYYDTCSVVQPSKFGLSYRRSHAFFLKLNPKDTHTHAFGMSQREREVGRERDRKEEKIYKEK